jgi:2-dehydro-3-deoxyglucarate aldolase/4-hydroxy-2-oxoheptanedioate aldolase
MAPFVRIPQPLYHFIARTMDAGALGVMVPNVESAAAAKQIVDAVKYAPLGARGVGLGGALSDYIQPNPAEFFKESNANTTVICQIESVAGVENAAEIAAVEGVDVLWVGHFDLTQSMGIPGEFDDPRFPEALKLVGEAADKHGKVAAIQPGEWGMAQQALDAGFKVISWKSDLTLYRAALQQEFAELRQKLGQG